MPILKEFDKTFFKTWSSDMAYILGFLFADGNIIKTKRETHFVAIYTSDRELLVSMAKAMKSNHKISTCVYETGDVYKMQIGSKELFTDLVALGLIPRKAQRMRLPEIPREYGADFIRGYFDGDGCVWQGRTHVKRKRPTPGILVVFVSASFHFLKGLFTLLKEFDIVGGSLYKSKSGAYARLSFSTLDSLKIYEIMYNKPHRLFLARKKLIFEKFIKLRS